MKNCAFVFIKPHAVTDPVKKLTEETFKAKDITILTQGSLAAEEIDKKMLIDQHYYAIASKATILKPAQLNVPAEKFKKTFGLEWADALAKGVVFNAKDACEQLGVDATGLDSLWQTSQKVKFGGGFYCGKIVSGEKTLYVFNGFFMQMRSRFVTPGCSIHYYVVEWDPASLSWEDFRGSVLGPTNPANAPADSLRGKVFSDWKALGLKDAPNTGDNAVHASASPFEGLAERMNWLGVAIEKDDFGKALLKAGVSKSTITAWSVDPQVTYGPIPIKGSLFDALEELDSDECVARAKMIAGESLINAKVIGAFAAGCAAGFIASKLMRN